MLLDIMGFIEHYIQALNYTKYKTVVVSGVGDVKEQMMLRIDGLYVVFVFSKYVGHYSENARVCAK